MEKTGAWETRKTGDRMRISASSPILSLYMKALKQIEQDWEDLAHIDPMWAIASDPTRQYGKWDPDEFFDSGRQRIDPLMRLIEQQAIPIQRGLCLDFGCGMGRFTQALAAHFERCQGIDISPQ